MRIISQNGNVDLPYEKALVFHAMETVLARCEGYDKEIVLGEYSSQEKAYKAMEMLREQYGKHYFGQGGAMATANYYVPAFGFIPPKVFQFPQDSEVEV